MCFSVSIFLYKNVQITEAFYFCEPVKYATRKKYSYIAIVDVDISSIAGNVNVDVPALLEDSTGPKLNKSVVSASQF